MTAKRFLWYAHLMERLTKERFVWGQTLATVNENPETYYVWHTRTPRCLVAVSLDEQGKQCVTNLLRWLDPAPNLMMREQRDWLTSFWYQLFCSYPFFGDDPRQIFSGWTITSCQEPGTRKAAQLNLGDVRGEWIIQEWQEAPADEATCVIHVPKPFFVAVAVTVAGDPAWHVKGMEWLDPEPAEGEGTEWGRRALVALGEYHDLQSRIHEDDAWFDRIEDADAWFE
jgi:hypothetical protein